MNATQKINENEACKQLATALRPHVAGQTAGQMAALIGLSLDEMARRRLDSALLLAAKLLADSEWPTQELLCLALAAEAHEAATGNPTFCNG